MISRFGKFIKNVFVSGTHSLFSGILILAGLIIFVTAEKLFAVMEKVTENEEKTKPIPVNNNTKGIVHEKKKTAVSIY